MLQPLLGTAFHSFQSHPLLDAAIDAEFTSQFKAPFALCGAIALYK